MRNANLTASNIVDGFTHRRERYAVFVAWLAGLITAAIGIFFTTTYVSYEEHLDATAQARSIAIDRIHDQFENLLPGIVADAVLIAELPALRRYAELGSAVDRDEVAEYLELSVKGNRSIGQFRYLDSSGMERIRIDRAQEAVRRIADEDLQNKADRYYFSESRNLPRHAFYLSALDLNVENGAVEEPWVPMLRVATPIFGTGETRAGVLVANIRAAQLLRLFSASGDPQNATYLLNDDGYFLAGAPTNRLWSFMFGGADKIADDARSMWARARQEGNGQLQISDSLYTYRSINPLDLLNDLFSERLVSFSGPIGQWTILDIRRVSFTDSLNGTLSVPVTAFLLLLLMILIMTSWFASGIVIDRRRLNRLQRTQERRMRDFVDHTGATMYIRDLAGRFTFANREFARNVGVAVDDLIGQKAVDVLPPSIHNRLNWVERKAHMGADGAGLEIAVDIDGQEHTLFVNVFDLVDEHGKADAVCSVGIDITKLKMIEDELRQAKTDAEQAKKAAEVASEAKATFLAAMSHEIRTPMNGIVGMIDLMGETKLDDDQRKMVSTVKGSAYALLGIIGDILDFSKLEAGRMTLENAPISLVDIMEFVGINLWSGATKKSLLMPMFCDPHIPAQVYGDQVRIRQVLINLIGNALKFTETTDQHQGKVIVRADLVTQQTDRVLVRFTVADNGIGMDQEVQSRLFTPFEQADASTVRRFGGTGLGLSICKQLVELMSGEISVESIPGEGSTFTLELWFDATAEVERNADLSGMRVLMVLRKDFPEAADFLTRYLTYWNCETEIVHDRESANASLSRGLEEDNPFDVVVIGQKLPLEEKIAFRDRIVATPGLSAQRFVIMDFEYQRALTMLSDNTVAVTGAPLCRTSFVTAVAVAAGRASPETMSLADENALPAVQAQTTDEARAEHRLILVAEDNETNQEVLRRQLTALGYAAVMVPDGRAALDAFRADDFALLLTDCHMPNMDGYELTSAIRAIERGTGRHLPIVAITANALQGEAERCLNIGMDDFIVKPIELRTFRAKLKKWLPDQNRESAMASAIASDSKAPSGEAIEPVAGPTAEETSLQILDVAILGRIVGNDRKLIVQTLESFVAPSRRIASEINSAFEVRDAKPIGFGAHKLKSSARTIGAMPLAKICSELERASNDADWTMIDELAPQFSQALQSVLTAIEIEQGRECVVEA